MVVKYHLLLLPLAKSICNTEKLALDYTAEATLLNNVISVQGSNVFTVHNSRTEPGSTIKRANDR